MYCKPTILLTIGSIICLISSGNAQVKFSADVLNSPSKHRTLLETTIPIKEIEIYQRTEADRTIHLENGYASFDFQNASDWPPQGADVIPTAVTIIFTKYPKDKSFWLTDYHWLLAKRLKSLFELDSRFNDQGVQFNILLQTDCENEFEAMQLYHGIRVTYRTVTEVPTPHKESPQNETLTHSSPSQTSASKKINRFIEQQKQGHDSVAFEVLDRHPEWSQATLVMDWTGSMYAHGADALLWHALNEQRSGIEHVVFFNDGDRKPTRKKIAGYTGGIYLSPSRPLSKPVKHLNRVKQRGNGGDSPENDMEALIKAIQEVPSSKTIILLADNQSCIRDFSLIGCIDRPVHIILCGTDKGVNHQYINLAWKTGGSIHTKDFDLENIHALIASDSLVIGGQRYTLTPDHMLMPTDRFGNRFGSCERYYRAQHRNIRKRRRNEPKCFFTD